MPILRRSLSGEGRCLPQKLTLTPLHAAAAETAARRYCMDTAKSACRCRPVAQVSNLLYRRIVSCKSRVLFPARREEAQFADYQSEIQQVHNLRYSGSMVPTSEVGLNGAEPPDWQAGWWFDGAHWLSRINSEAEPSEATQRRRERGETQSLWTPKRIANPSPIGQLVRDRLPLRISAFSASLR
jgi:hypothetical protein